MHIVSSWASRRHHTFTLMLITSSWATGCPRKLWLSSLLYCFNDNVLWCCSLQIQDCRRGGRICAAVFDSTLPNRQKWTNLTKCLVTLCCIYYYDLRRLSSPIFFTFLGLQMTFGQVVRYLGCNSFFVYNFVIPSLFLCFTTWMTFVVLGEFNDWHYFLVQPFISFVGWTVRRNYSVIN